MRINRDCARLHLQNFELETLFTQKLGGATRFSAPRGRDLEIAPTDGGVVKTVYGTPRVP